MSCSHLSMGKTFENHNGWLGKGNDLRIFYPIILLIALGGVSHFSPSAEAHFINERHVYVRAEKVLLEFQSSAKYVIFDVDGWSSQRIRVVDGAARYSFDSNLLRSADYHVRANPVEERKDVGEAVVFPLTITPARNPQRYPVWHWGNIPNEDIGYWTRRGFNGFRRASSRAPLGKNDQSIQRTINLLVTFKSVYLVTI